MSSKPTYEQLRGEVADLLAFRDADTYLINRLSERVSQLGKVIHDLVEEYIANKGTEHQFVVTKTVSNGTPKYWQAALDVLSELRYDYSLPCETTGTTDR